MNPSLPINKITIIKKANVRHLLKYLQLTEEDRTFYDKALMNIGNDVNDDIIEEDVNIDDPFV